MMIRAGISWRIVDDLMIEAAFNWEDWSVQQRLIVDPQGGIKLHNVPGIGDYEMGPLTIDRRLRDTYSLHLGGDGRIVDTLHLRGGVFWEPSAFRDETFSQINPTNPDQAEVIANGRYSGGYWIGGGGLTWLID
jgi:long-subunit fatty acid transport protein